jgi:prevent-host-death family protein
MNTANISYTRNHLSELLDRVREGETVLIVDRDQPVARLQPVGESDSDGPEWKAGLIRKGVIRSAAHRLDTKELRAMPMPQTQKNGDVVAALLADRESDR